MPRKSNRRTIPLARLAEVWAAYCEFRRGQIAPSTYDRDYNKFTQRLKRLQKEAPQLRNAIAIRDWLLANYSHDSTRRTIQQFNAACRWAEESDMLQRNPFAGVGRQCHGARMMPGGGLEPPTRGFSAQQYVCILMSRKKRRFPPLYWPYKSWKQMLIGNGIFFVGLSLFYVIRYLILSR